MEKTPFYSSGLRFSCKRCSACCRYDAGFVFLSEKDIDQLAKAFQMDKKQFFLVYCRWVTDWKGNEVPSLKEKSNKDCILWDSGCTVYNARPLQCVTFPFWNSILASRENWEAAASGCPGMNSGELHTEKMIEKNINLRAVSPCLQRGSE